MTKAARVTEIPATNVTCVLRGNAPKTSRFPRPHTQKGSIASNCFETSEAISDQDNEMTLNG